MCPGGWVRLVSPPAQDDVGPMSLRELDPLLPTELVLDFQIVLPGVSVAFSDPLPAANFLDSLQDCLSCTSVRPASQNSVAASPLPDDLWSSCLVFVRQSSAKPLLAPTYDGLSKSWCSLSHIPAFR